MKRWLRLIIGLVIVECCLGLWWCGERLFRPNFPKHNPLVLDRLTSDSLNQVRSQLSADRMEDWSRLGELYLVFGSYLAAEACYQHALSERPNHVETLLGTGLCQERLGRYEAANQTFESLLQVCPSTLREELKYRIGRNLLRQERIADAELAFRDAINFPPAAYQLAKLLVRTDRAADALPIVESLLQLNPDVMESNQLAEQTYRTMGDAVKATRYREKLDRCPSRLATGRTISVFQQIRQQHGVRRLLVDAAKLEQQGQIEDACHLYETAWNIDQAEPIALRAAELRGKLNQPDAAVAICNRQETVGGCSSGLLEIRGKAFAARNQIDDAITDWKRSQSLLIRPAVCRELSKAWQSQGESDAARRQQGLAEYADGIRLYRLNRIAQAQDHLTRSLALDPENASAHFYLGQIQRLSGNADNAIASWRRCLELQPGHGRAFAALQTATLSETP